jgi:hypothetical protein
MAGNETPDRSDQKLLDLWNEQPVIISSDAEPRPLIDQTFSEIIGRSKFIVLAARNLGITDPLLSQGSQTPLWTGVKELSTGDREKLTGIPEGEMHLCYHLGSQVYEPPKVSRKVEEISAPEAKSIVADMDQYPNPYYVHLYKGAALQELGKDDQNFHIPICEYILVQRTFYSEQDMRKTESWLVALCRRPEDLINGPLLEKMLSEMAKLIKVSSEDYIPMDYLNPAAVEFAPKAFPNTDD